MKTTTASPYTVRVLNLEQLSRIGSLEHGITIHCGIIVIWDEDHDGRILTVLDRHFGDENCCTNPIAACEHKGGITLLWETHWQADAANKTTYTDKLDEWCQSNWFVQDDDAIELFPERT